MQPEAVRGLQADQLPLAFLSLLLPDSGRPTTLAPLAANQTKFSNGQHVQREKGLTNGGYNCAWRGHPGDSGSSSGPITLHRHRTSCPSPCQLQLGVSNLPDAPAGRAPVPRKLHLPPLGCGLHRTSMASFCHKRPFLIMSASGQF